MKYLIFLLFVLGACSQNRSDFMQKPGAEAKKECPLYKKERLLPIAKITFDVKSLTLTPQDQSILSEVAEMHRRCGGRILINGYRLSSEDEDYGLLRAGIVFKEIEKAGVASRFMRFNQKAGEKTDVVISLQM